MQPLQHLAPKDIISVVIPVYNGEKYLAEALESVLSQTYTNYEIIAVDDGSTDGSAAVLARYAEKVSVIRQENRDVSAARNAGIRAAKGKFIAFLDQDDWWLPDKLSVQLQAFSTYPEADVVFTNLVKFNNAGGQRMARDKHRLCLRLRDNNVFRLLAVKNLLMPSAVMSRKSSLVRAGLFDESFKTCGDYQLWLRMAGRGMRFRYIPAPLTMYRQHTGNTARHTALMHSDRIKAVESAFTDPALDPVLLPYRDQALAAAYALGAHTFFSARDYRMFLESFRQARRHHFPSVLTPKLLGRFLRGRLITAFARQES
jgi:glycosyltransferase involved in cell wall biosynthesis